MQALEAVEAVLAVQEKTWIPQEYSGNSYFGALDIWHYYARGDNTCDQCMYYDGTDLSGQDLRSWFPYLEIDGENTAQPHVHPNCRCLMTRINLTDKENPHFRYPEQIMFKNEPYTPEKKPWEIDIE
jgi:hypothetical protein